MPADLGNELPIVLLRLVRACAHQVAQAQGLTRAHMIDPLRLQQQAHSRWAPVRHRRRPSLSDHQRQRKRSNEAGTTAQVGSNARGFSHLDPKLAARATTLHR